MQADDDAPTDPKENPVGTGHLPVSGEVGVGPVPYHDPVTTDTDDGPPPDSVPPAPQPGSPDVGSGT